MRLHEILDELSSGPPVDLVNDDMNGTHWVVRIVGDGFYLVGPGPVVHREYNLCASDLLRDDWRLAMNNWSTNLQRDAHLSLETPKEPKP